MSDKNPDTFTAKQKEVLVNAGLLANRQPVFLLGLLADVHIEYEELEQRLEEAQRMVVELADWHQHGEIHYGPADLRKEIAERIDELAAALRNEQDVADKEAPGAISGKELPQEE